MPPNPAAPGQPLAAHVRLAAEQDSAAISALLAELAFPADPATVSSRLRKLDAADETILVAELNGQVVGLATAHVTPVLHRPTPVGRITALVVASSARRRGIGAELVRAAEDHLRKCGCALLELTSNHRLTEAHTFYQRLGFTITSHRFCKPLDP